MQKPLIYIDMDDVMCEFTAAHNQSKFSSPEIEYPQSVPGFFLALKPVKDAIDIVNELREQFDVYILTAPSTRNPHCYSEKRIWIEEHFDYAFTKKLILSPNKGLLIGDYLIDDHTSGRGQESFQGRVLHFGSPEYPDWKTVRNYLNSITHGS